MSEYLVCASHRPRLKTTVHADSYAMAISKGAVALDVHRDCVVVLAIKDLRIEY